MNQATYTSVRDVMTPDPRIVDGLATVSQAVALMRQHGVSSLVIDKRHPGDEYGIVVMQDIAARVIGENRAADRISVYEIMSKPVLLVDTEMDIKYAIRMLVRFGLSRALVADAGKLVGIGTMRDMVLRFLPD